MSIQNSPNVIAIDIDSTIYSAENLYDVACQKLHGVSFYEDGNRDWYDVEDLVERFGENYQEIFVEALSPRHFDKRALYEGVEDILWEMQEYGMRVHFVTHNPDPYVRCPLHRWLKGHFGDDVGLSITVQGRKGPILNRIGASYFIDDSPPNMVVSLRMGIPTFSKRQPWNEKFLLQHPEVIAFDEWEELRPLLLEERTLVA
jgi:hypothetical protein